jgi:hypothetical protein
MRRMEGRIDTPRWPISGPVCRARRNAVSLAKTELRSRLQHGRLAAILGAMVTPDRLSALFKAYHAPLVRFLTRRLGDRDWAEELAQETFVRALKQDEIASERSWLFAVASNLVRDEARREARERKRHDLMRTQAEASRRWSRSRRRWSGRRTGHCAAGDRDAGGAGSDAC